MTLPATGYDEEDLIIGRLKRGLCPDCLASKSMLEGPHGGDSVNIKCKECGSEFNVCLPFFAERI